MRQQKQAFRHDPANGVFGDCYRSCLAAMLDLDRDDVPHLVTTMDPTEWEQIVQPKYDAWLAEQGLQELAIPVAANNETCLNTILEWQKTRTKVPTLAMLTGESRTGCNHAVLVRDGQIVYDPSQDDASIVGPCHDGLYWVIWLMPLPKKIESTQDADE